MRGFVSLLGSSVVAVALSLLVLPGFAEVPMWARPSLMPFGAAFVVFRLVWPRAMGHVPRSFGALAWLALVGLGANAQLRRILDSLDWTDPRITAPSQVWLGTITMVGAAAVAWILAERIRARGVASGTWVIGGGLLLAGQAGELVQAGYDFGRGFALDGAATPWGLSAMLVLATALQGYSAPREPDSPLPRTLWGMAMVPLVGEAVAGWANQVWWDLVMNDTRWALPVGVGALLATLAVGRALWSYPGPRRLAVGLPFAPVPAVVGGALLFAGIARSPGGLDGYFGPEPFEGGQSGMAVLTSAEAPSSDTEVLRSRLGFLGVDVEVVPDGPGEARVELRDVTSIDVVLDAVVRRRWLTLHPAVLDDERLPPVGAVRARECAEPSCRDIWLLEPLMSATHVEEASVVTHDDGAPLVLLELTDAGAEIFGRWTTDHVAHQFAMVLDGEVLSAPYVREPILGGAASVYMPGKSMVEAHALAASINAPPLRGVWHYRVGD